MFSLVSDDISLTCYTSDLQNITCQWNGSRYGKEKDYKLFYNMDIRYIHYIVEFYKSSYVHAKICFIEISPCFFITSFTVNSTHITFRDIVLSNVFHSLCRPKEVGLHMWSSDYIMTLIQ